MNLNNYDAAMQFMKSEKDVGLQQFMARAVTAAVRRSVEVGQLDGEFDLLFFVQTISDLYQQKENLVKVLLGEDLRWWPEEE